MKTSIYKRALAVAALAVGLASAPAHAAFIVNENTIEGNWFTEPSAVTYTWSA